MGSPRSKSTDKPKFASDRILGNAVGHSRKIPLRHWVMSLSEK